MVRCEICGQLSLELRPIKLEGATMQACPKCTKYGEPERAPKDIALHQTRILEPQKVIPQAWTELEEAPYGLTHPVWQYLHKVRKDPLLLVGLVLFSVVSFAEVLYVRASIGTVTLMYSEIVFFWWFVLAIQWPVVLHILRANHLSKVSRGLYATFTVFITVCIYLILLYPIIYWENPPPSGVFFEVGPVFIGGITGTLVITSYFYRDIEVRKRTGKSMWEIRDSYIKKREKRGMIELLLLFPSILFIGFPAAGLIYKLSEFFGLPWGLRFLLAVIPTLALIGRLLRITLHLNKEIKQRMNLLTSGNEDIDWEEAIGRI